MKIAVVSVVTDPSEILNEQEIRAITSKLEGRTVGISELQQVIDEINELSCRRTSSLPGHTSSADGDRWNSQDSVGRGQDWRS